jgi:nitrilase
VTSGQQFVLRGGSAIIAPDGRYVREPVFDAPALLVAELDPGLTREESMTLDVTGHYSRPDVFAFELNPHRRVVSS